MNEGLKVKMSAIHKLVIEAECSCSVAAEYSDAAYKESLTLDPIFTPCPDHVGVPGLDLLVGVLKQSLFKEAKDYKLPSPARPTVQRTEAGAKSEVERVPDANGEIKIPITRPGGHKPRTPGGTPRVVGGSAGVRRVDPSSMLGKRASAPGAAAALAARTSAAAKTASAPSGLDMDLDAAPEDKRLTQLLKAEGIEDILAGNDSTMESDDEGDDMDDLLDD